MKSLGLEKVMRDLRIFRIFEGTNDILRFVQRVLQIVLIRFLGFFCHISCQGSNLTQCIKANVHSKHLLLLLC